MDVHTEAPPPMAPNAQQPHPSQTTVSSAPANATSAMPSSPNLSTPNPRRTTNHSNSPLNPSYSPAPSPRPPSVIRRSSSSTSLNQRPSSSPHIMRKSSRSSLGGPQPQPEEQENRPTPKRSISNLITGLRDAQKTMESIEEPVPLTAPQIALEHFARELVSHAQPDSQPAETVVILHDACYGHRFSRPKTTKSTLSMIVERPERLHASVLGAAAAYVRLGAHHEGGANAPHPDRRAAGRPPFKMRRTGRTMDITSSCVTNVHGTAWMGELKELCGRAGGQLATGAKELSREGTGVDAEKKKLHEGDLYLAAESLDAFQGALGGVADAVDSVFAPGSPTRRAFVAVRPPGHHCSADHPSGFCWLNNVHVGIEYAAQTYGLTHAAILDFDLHHGDGSQAITWERNSRNNLKRQNAKPNSKLKLGPEIGYYSLHDINSYPCEWGDDEKVQAASLCVEDAHSQSIWNVHLEEWKTVAEFWKLYETRYSVLLEKARKFLRKHTAKMKAEGKVQPKVAIFISAGFDASEWEGAGMQRHKVNVPTEFYARFTQDVVRIAQEEGSGCDGKVISVLEGGYSDRALCSGVMSHLSGLCTTPTSIAKQPTMTNANDLDQMMRGLGITDTSSSSDLQYNADWWSPANLLALEMKVNPPPPPGPGKKVRTGPQPTYATPTESFAYKVVDTNKFARSISGTMREVPRPARPPTPPAPEVDWVVATQELSKLLIPTDRQTRSCTPEELGGVKVKKEVQQVSAAPVGERQLRDRKGKAPVGYAHSAHSDEPAESSRSVSRSSRRETIAVLPSSAEPPPELARRASRRLSAGSTLSSATMEVDQTAPPVPTIPRSRPSTANGAMKPPAAVGMQMKKTRAPPAAKPKKSSAPTSAPVSPARMSKQSAVPAGAVANGAPRKPADGVDALTSGMKKVTLKVGSREEHDRKQKEKLDAERRARALKGAETRRVNAAAKKAREREIGGLPVPQQASGAQLQQQHAEPVVANGREAAPLFSVPSMPPPAPTLAVEQDPFSAAASIPMAGPSAHPHLDQTAQPSYPGATNEDVAFSSGYGTPVFEEQQQDLSMELAQESQPLHEPSGISTHAHALACSSSPPGPTSNADPSVPDSAACQFIQEARTADFAAPLAYIPQVASPRGAAKGQLLPVWNSTGPIPFAPVGGSDDGRGAQAQSGLSGSGTESDVIMGSSDHTELSTGAGAEVASRANIWDVPVRPPK